MKDNLEQLGIALVMNGSNQFAKAAKDYAKQITDMNKASGDYSKSTDKASASTGKLVPILGATGAASAAAAIGVKILGAAISFALHPITLIITAIAAMGAAVGKLGMRGAEVRGIETAFANLISPVLGADETIQGFIDNLRKAAGDTIPQIELLRATNLALAGTSGALRDTFAKSLPALLEIARVQAAATGESVQFLFDSLVRGIKRGSPLIIDNTGLVLDLTAANETLAKQLGITVDQMSEEQKTIALINATVAAGGQAIEAAGGIQITAATRLATIQSLISNTIDNIAKGVEPLLNAFLGFITPVFSALEQASRSFGSFIQAAANRISAFVSTLQTAFTLANNIIQGGGQVISSGFIGNIAAGSAYLFEIVKNSISNTVTFMAGAIPSFIKSGFALVAALGNAYLAAANQFIFPVVVQIATFIADFLTGFSPAKRGPLSKIDKGAQGLAMAWSEGFAGVFVPNAQEAAAEVEAALGAIGGFGIQKVERRLAQLDMALRPFQERLALAKANFEALQEPAQAALNVIDRQLEKATQALASGDEASAQVVRNLNLQRAAWESRLDLQQEQLDKAQLGLSLSQAQQAQERALLNIQKDRLGKTKEIAKEVKKTVKEVSPAAGKDPASGGKTEIEPPAVSGGAGVNQEKVDEFLGNAEGEAAVDSALAGLDDTLAGLSEFGSALGADFLAGLNAGGELDTALGFGDELATQFDRIGASDPVQGILGAFDGLGDGLAEAGGLAVEGFLNFFTNPDTQGSIPYFINDINTRGASAVFGDIGAAITSWIQTSIIDPVRDGSLLTFFDPFNMEGFYAPFYGIAEGIPTAIGDLKPVLEGVFAGAQEWILGQSEGGGLPALVSGIVDSFSGLPSALFDVLQFIGLVLFDVFVAPMVAVIDQFIATTNNFLNSILESEFINFLRSNPVTSPLFQDFPSTVTIAALSTVVNRSIFMPVKSPEIQGAKTGGLFTGGLLDVHKDERIFSAEPMGVMNAQFVRAMDSLGELMQGSQGFGMGINSPQSVSNTSSVDNSVTVNSNTGFRQSAAEVANRVAVARIFGI